MKKNALIILIVMVLSLVWIAPALADLAPGHLDTGFDPGTGTNNEKVHLIALAPDGRIVIGGDFTQVDGISRNRIARLNADGSLDTTFLPSPGPDNSVIALTVQPDGKVLVGGQFTSMNAVTQSGIARLNTNGTLDTSFNPGSSMFNNVSAIALQPNGKIIICYRYLKIDDSWFWKISRLNSDGSIDTKFTPVESINSSIRSMALQANGKIVIGGAFTQLAGANHNRIARLNTDGTLDTGFDPGAGANDDIEAVAIRNDEKILIGGRFTSINWSPKSKVALLNTDGSVDTNFYLPTDSIDYNVYALAVQPDGNVLIGGSFTTVRGYPCNRIARLTEYGFLDSSFNPGSGATDTIFALALEPDNKVVIGGYFTSFNGIPNINHIARLNRDGSRDIAFKQGASGGVFSGEVNSLALQQNGKIVIGGNFNDYGGETRKNVARLLANGTVDDSFVPPSDTNDIVYAVAIAEANNSVFIAGDFTQVGGQVRNKIARLEQNGNLHLGFDPGDGPNGIVYALLIQPDGKILIGGNFTKVRNTERNKIARLNADGTLDKNFNPGACVGVAVLKIALQEDGKILIGGVFSSFSGTPRNSIARLNADGSLDTRFNSVDGLVGNSVTDLAIMQDGKIIIGGEFTSFDGSTRNRVARLNSNGTLDTRFDPGIGPNNVVEALEVQSDGKVVIGGMFTLLNNISQNRLARLNADGTQDPSFNIGTGVNLPINDLVIQPDGKIIIGGSFTTVWEVSNQNRIARLNGATPPVFLISTLPDAMVGEDYSHRFSAESFPYAPRFYVTEGNLPIGLSLNSLNGILSGIPRDDGSATFTVSACNFVTPCVARQLTLTIEPAPKPGNFVKISPLNGAVNQPTNPTLAWETSSYATSYDYCYATTQTCSEWISNGNKTSKALSGLTPNTTYFWHVRAKNDAGTTYANGSSDALWSFTTVAPGAQVSSAFTATPTSGPAPLTVDFTNESEGDFNACVWDFGDGATSTSCEKFISHIYQVEGMYTVKLTVSGGGGTDTRTRANYITVGDVGHMIFLPLILR